MNDGRESSNRTDEYEVPELIKRTYETITFERRERVQEAVAGSAGKSDSVRAGKRERGRAQIIYGAPASAAAVLLISFSYLPKLYSVTESARIEVLDYEPIILPDEGDFPLLSLAASKEF